jgi:hypothetical protein
MNEKEITEHTFISLLRSSNHEEDTKKKKSRGFLPLIYLKIETLVESPLSMELV